MDQMTPKCAKCDVPLQCDVAEPKDDDILSCPDCGASDTLKKVRAEVSDYIQEQAANIITTGLAHTASKSKNITFSKEPRAKRVYRFKV